MSEQLPFDLPPAPERSVGKKRRTAREARDVGVATVVTHARAKDPDWMRRAVAWVRVYAERHKELMCEDVRVFAATFGFKEPEGVDKRVWGGVMPAAARAGIVDKIGLAYAKDPKVHMNPAGAWASLVYQERVR